MGLVDLAISGSTWIRADRWEGMEPRFVNYDLAQRSLDEFLAAWCEKNGFGTVPKVLLVAGGDLAKNLYYSYPSRNLGCVFIERPGYPSPPCLSLETQSQKNFFVLSLSGPTEDISSSEIQKFLFSGDPEKLAKVSTLLHPDVEARLKEIWNVNKQ
jgi:hypothetical protein